MGRKWVREKGSKSQGEDNQMHQGKDRHCNKTDRKFLKLEITAHVTWKAKEKQEGCVCRVWPPRRFINGTQGVLTNQTEKISISVGKKETSK